MAKRIPILLYVVTLLVFASAVGAVTWVLRKDLRVRFIQQHAAILQPMAEAQLSATRDELAMNDDLLDASELLSLSLQDINVPELLDVRLFHPDGFLMTEDLEESLSVTLRPDSVVRAQTGLATAYYDDNASVGQVFVGQEDEMDLLGIPVLEAVVPLRSEDGSQPLALARYLLSGAGVRDELERIDRGLWRNSGWLFLIGSAVLGGVFGIAFRSLNRSRRLLNTSEARLNEATTQLLLSDKASAIGSLSAHLIHGIKNPIAGMRAVLGREPTEDGQVPLSAEEYVQCGQQLTRMQRMVGDLVSLLKEEESPLAYEYTLAEVRELLLEKMRPSAASADVRLSLEGAPEWSVPGRAANILLLILVNLVDNALEASQAGDSVSVTFHESEKGTPGIEVRDQGPGIPDALQARLFVPKPSEKEHGAGIGLAIAAQLARNIGASLTLKRSSTEGTCFSIVLSEFPE